MKKQFLITGITGFVGAWLAMELYKRGHKVSALVRSSNGREADVLDVVSQDCYEQIKFIYGDLNDYQSLEKIFQENKFDGCFHLAAQSHPPTGLLDPIGTLKTNLIGSANLFLAIEKNNPECKIHACSTSEVYGNSGKDGQLLTEESPLAPSNPYATGKLCMETHLQERMMNGKVKGFITRAFSHCAPRRGKNFSISSDAYQLAAFMLDAVARKENGTEEITYKLKVGNLKTIRAVCDGRCVARAYVDLMESEKSNGKVYNICADKARPMEFFTDMLIKLSGLKVEKVVDENLYRKIDIKYQKGDTTLVKKAINWQPEIPIEETLASLLDYWITKLTQQV